MKTTFTCIAAMCLLLLFSCQDSFNKEAEGATAIASAMDLTPPMDAKTESVGYLEPPPPPASPKINFSPSQNTNTIPEPQRTTENKKKIIKDGDISVKTQDIAISKKNIDEALKNLNAYYETEDLQNNDYRISYDLKVRIPSENFEKLISMLESGKDEITAKNIHARDVTEEYVDIEIRLTNKRSYLKRYQELLSKARNVEEILQIEENIRALEEEIESSEGRLKFLDDQVAYSTLQINLFRDKPYIYKAPEEDGFGERVKRSMSNGWKGVINFVLALVSLWPFIIAIIIIIYFVRRFIKKRRSKQKN